ncbi:DEAD-box ATP-dependent RNA helicase 13 [Glycine max]|nr:DEAD-box ATP-dependent RNA helicase 13 [Glycine max]
MKMAYLLLHMLLQWVLILIHGVRTVIHYQLPHSTEDNFQRFPLENSYVPEEKAEKKWLDRSASTMELVKENYDSEEEQVNKHKQMKTSSKQLKKLQEELKMLISCPLQSKTFLHRYLAGILPLLCLYFTLALTF